jgi:type VI secretion system protein VasG
MGRRCAATGVPGKLLAGFASSDTSTHGSFVMLIAQPRSLLQRLSPYCTRLLEAAAAECVSGGQDEVRVEHLLVALWSADASDWQVAANHYGVDGEACLGAVRRSLATERRGQVGRPVFSRRLLEWIQDSWVWASVELRATELRSAMLLARFLQAPEQYTALVLTEIERIPIEAFSKEFEVVCAASVEAPRAAVGATPTGGSTRATGGTKAAGDGPLERFTSDLTERARAGAIDPVLGREKEIRQVVDVLVRRRKNNPIIVGEPGVGKTALVEGLALRIAEGSVPEVLANSRVLALDLGALQAGAGVRGEFENRLKGVIDAVKSSEQPIILFIDEAHTLIGAGGAQGGGDAANLLKPALARGELRTVAATTYAEFKKYFEKDAALERRFQPVRVDEPSLEQAETMLRGLAETFRTAHGVIIRDEAVRAAVSLSARYISGRQLPDKAVDLLDTAAAFVKVVRKAPPARLEDARAGLKATEREIAGLLADETSGAALDHERLVDARAKKEKLETEVATLEANLLAQLDLVAKLDAARADGEGEADARKHTLARALDALAAVAPADRLLYPDVDEAVIASIVSTWTGVPVGKMVQDDVRSVLDLEPRLGKRVRGQGPALAVLGRELRAARAGMKAPNAPLGVFLLVGPSGVGKTETALALADLMFGGERFMTTINMSEFQERHSISRLIGSPPGYVGYGEGGVLTEAVRHRPYSVVLLDEIEKADPEVLNLFYQVFDKGMLSDGEGRVVDFSNTVVVMTSNLATDLLTEAASPDRELPDHDELVELVRPTLSKYLKPALLARMTVVPYVPIRREALLDIARMKVNAATRRAAEAHRLEVDVAEDVVSAIAERCREVESGARNVDHILRKSLLPKLSLAILEALADAIPMKRASVTLGPTGEFSCTVSN